MLVKPEAYDQNINRLIRATSQKLFRFIIIQYPHKDVIEEIEQIIRSEYPGRNLLPISAAREDFHSLMEKLSGKENDFVLITDFDHLISNKDIYIGFNQVRDKIAESAVTLVVFIPNGIKYVRKLQKNLPDFWSFRTLVLDLPVKSHIKIKEPGEFIEPQSTVENILFNAKEEQKEFERLEKRIATLTDDQFSLKINLQVQAAEICHTLGIYEKGLSLMEDAHKLSSLNKLRDSNPGLMVTVLYNKAVFKKALGKYNEAKDLIVQALDIAKANNIETIKNLKLLANVYSDLGEYEKARDLLQEALKSDLENFGEKHPQVATGKSNLANVYKVLGEYEKARDLLQEALKSDLDNFGGKHPTVAIKKSNLANIYLDLGEYEKARDLLQEALKSDLENFGGKHPKVATRKSNLANVYKGLGEFEKARDLLQEALKSDLEHFGEKHPKVATSQSNLANVYKALGEHEKARDLLEAALKSDLDNFGRKHPTVAIKKSNLALVYFDLGEYEKARDLLEEALKSDLENFVGKHPTVAISKSNLAFVYKALGENKKADDLGLSAYKIFENSLGKDHPNTKVALQFLEDLKSGDDPKLKS